MCTVYEEIKFFEGGFGEPSPKEGSPNNASGRLRIAATIHVHAKTLRVILSGAKNLLEHDSEA
jgi:hypothetical protein